VNEMKPWNCTCTFVSIQLHMYMRLIIRRLGTEDDTALSRLHAMGFRPSVLLVPISSNLGTYIFVYILMFV